MRKSGGLTGQELFCQPPTTSFFFHNLLRSSPTPYGDGSTTGRQVKAWSRNCTLGSLLPAALSYLPLAPPRTGSCARTQHSPRTPTCSMVSLEWSCWGRSRALFGPGLGSEPSAVQSCQTFIPKEERPWWTLTIIFTPLPGHFHRL